MIEDLKAWEKQQDGWGACGWTFSNDGGFFDQINDIGRVYSQFLHLLHAYRYAAHLLGDHSPATGQGKQTHASISIKKERKEKEKEE